MTLTVYTMNYRVLKYYKAKLGARLRCTYCDAFIWIDDRVVSLGNTNKGRRCYHYECAEKIHIV